MSTTKQNPPIPPKTEKKPARPNETGSVTVEAFLKISDPKTQKVYLEGRA